METSRLYAISPLDGRYQESLKNLTLYVSEAALIGYRLRVEAQWLLHLASIPGLAEAISLKPVTEKALRKVASGLPEGAATAVKAFEAETNHDVKAVEYYLVKYLKENGASDQELAFIHFACTSEDINNTAYALMLEDARCKVLLPAMQGILDRLKELALAARGLPMLSRTHGQPASPTTLGKELAVFGHRLLQQVKGFRRLPLTAKANGAVGNYNAHIVAFPQVDWRTVNQKFIESLGLTFNPLTTQIENHDAMAEYLDALRRFNIILLGFCRDVWGYISLGYFSQKLVDAEVGSSTMPHKVNPIDFENAEGNLGIAISLSQHFVEKLPVSRWQRDLSDSTVQRSLGSLLGHTLVSLKAVARGLGKVAAEPQVMNQDLEQHWEVLAEALQTVLRRHGVSSAYEQLKEKSRGRGFTKKDYENFLKSCTSLPKQEVERLAALTPQTYTGLAQELVEEFVEAYDAAF